MAVEPLTIRSARPQDIDELAILRHALWPDSSAAEHAEELRHQLGSAALPLVLLAQDPDGRIIGFLEAGLRSHAEGCDASQPVGYLEGWYVDPAYRRQGVGAQLLAEAEAWARTQGSREMASDTWPENLISQRVHQALGFEETGRSVNYRKHL